MRTKAIILKKQNANEYDQLVTCYTEEFGKIVAIAKSVMKPGSIQGHHLDVFNLADFDLISGRGVPIITGAQSENTYPNLKNSIQCLSAGYFFAETADRLFYEYQKDNELWHFFTSLLDDLESRPADLNEFLKLRQVEFLNILGYAPNLDECAFCTRSLEAGPMAYNVEIKGVVCQSCFLGGQKGIVLKRGNIHSKFIIEAIFESLSEKKLSSLSLINSVINLRDESR